MIADDSDRCPQCGRSMSDATRTSQGLAICARCAHSVASRASDGEKSTQVLLPEELVREVGSSRFRLAGSLGEGGFGTVYRAFDLSLRRHVAIKVPKRTYGRFDAKQFILEARAASRLRHPNVVTIFDVGFVEEAPFIVSDCIEGVSLRQWLEGPQATYTNVAKVAEKLCRALAYAHAMGVVHRDVKPSNVIVDDANEPHLLDFGLSSSRATGDAVRFRSDSPAGTPAYMAPEQILGDLSQIGQATDIYALGVVLYQMLSRKLPFVGSPTRIFELAVESEPVRPRTLDPRIPIGLEAIALKAMRKSAQERYATADAMADDLVRFLEGRPVKALGRHDRRSLAMTARRRFMGGLAATASVGCLGAGACIAYLRYRDDPRVWVRLEANGSADDVRWQLFDEYGGGVAPEDPGEMGRGDEWMKLVPGLYRVEVRSGAASRVVYRTVPAPGQPMVVLGEGSRGDASSPAPELRWRSWRSDGDGGEAYLLPSVDLQTRPIAESMQRCKAGSVYYPRLDDRWNPYQGEHRLGAFDIDRFETTVADVVAAFGRPVFNAGQPLTSPATLPFPVALEYAERRNASLMTAWEWLYAATNEGRTRFPWGDVLPEDATWASLAAIDVTATPPGISGLFSGLAEWTETPLRMPETSGTRRSGRTHDLPASRAVVGYPPSGFVRTQPLDTEHVFRFAYRPLNEAVKPVGVRCVRRL